MSKPIAEDFAAIAARLAEIKAKPAQEPRPPGQYTDDGVEALRALYAAGGTVVSVRTA